ncbi:MAG: hypothetical protein ACOZB3_02830 [Calditrichota bacterium]
MLARFFLIIAAMCFLVAPAFAQDQAMDANWGRVFVEVLPTVAVYYSGAEMNLGAIDALDEVCATLMFTVHANGQDIAMRCGASKLFKDDIPTSRYWIPVNPEHLARISAAYGQFHEGAPVNELVHTVGPYGDVSVYHTDWFNFGSGDGGTWSYDVEVFICWLGDDAELFQGDYSGGVVLWAMYVDI